MSLATAHQELYSTPLDILRKVREMPSESIDFSMQPFQFGSIARFEAALEDNCLSAYGIINGYLEAKYNAPAGIMTSTPVAIIPVQDPENNDPASRLINVSIASSATTTFWTVTFTGTTTFSVKSFHYGSQGTGNTSQEFTSTNSHVVIETGAWDGSFVQNDKIYFSVRRVHPMVWSISVMLSTAIALQDTFSINTSSSVSDKMYDRAIKLLEQLVDDENPLSLSGADVPDAIAITYKVDMYGRDQSDYLTENEIDY